MILIILDLVSVQPPLIIYSPLILGPVLLVEKILLVETAHQVKWWYCVLYCGLGCTMVVLDYILVVMGCTMVVLVVKWWYWFDNGGIGL